MTLTERKLLRSAMRMCVDMIGTLNLDSPESTRQDIRSLYRHMLALVVELNYEIDREEGTE